MDNVYQDRLNIATKTKLGDASLKDTATINSLDNVKITKVLTVTAKPKIENITASNAEAKFDGSVQYDLLVVLENGEISPLTTKTSFSHVFENSNILPETTLCILPSLVDLENTQMSDYEVKYTSSIDFEIFAINQNSGVECAKPIENVFVKESEVSFDVLVDDLSHEFCVEFDESKDNKFNKVLFVTNYATVKSVVPSNDYFAVSGDVFSTIVYQSDEGTIKSTTKQNSFSEEIESKGTTKESNVQLCISTRDTTIVENTEKGVFSFSVPVCLKAQVFNKEVRNCVTDAYSLQYEVNLTTVSVNQSEFLQTRQVEENILTNFELTDNMPSIDKILAIVPTNIVVSNQIVKDKELLLEGVASLNIIYYTEDEEGTNLLNSIDVDVPYSINLQIPELLSFNNVASQIILGDVNVKAKKGRELEILAEAFVNYNIVKDEISAITTNITLGEEKPSKDFALEIYLAKDNESLWNIAKELNISTDDLVSQNQELSLPIKSGDKIIAYHQRKFDID